jgi:hypothetical protein
MNVQSSTRRRALLDIYQSHHKGRSGVLSARQLERDWKKTGLRRSDLDAAIKDLTQKQLLLSKRAHDGISYELTYLGECAMQLQTAGGGPLAFLRDWLTLRRAKLRQRMSAEQSDNVPHNRRKDDRRDSAKANEPGSVRLKPKH